MLPVHLRFTDARTKKPLPVRLRIEDANGAVFAPLGRLPVFASGRGEALGPHLRVGQQNFSLIDGSCEVRLPTGVPLRIQAFHGPEYYPFEREVTLGAGQMALRFEMQPWFDRAVSHLLSGDSRAHFASPHDALLEAEVEDLDIVNLLACDAALYAEDGNAYRTVSNIAAFSGQAPALERDGRSVVVNTLNEHPMLGRLALLNSHRPVYPLTFGGDEFDDWSLWDWCQQCHRKNGLAVWVNAFRPESSLLGGEALAACILGQIDAIEFDAAPRSQPLLPWVYKLWSLGFRAPLVGGSGKTSNRVPLGAMRTYARLNDGEPRNFDSWIQAVREGRTFISNGPILNWNATASQVSAESVVPFERLEVVANGRVICKCPAMKIDDFWRAEMSGEVELPADGWWALRCIGGIGSALFPAMSVFAHSSSIRLGSGSFTDAAASEPLRKCLELTCDWIRREGRFQSERFREAIIQRCETAMAALH